MLVGKWDGSVVCVCGACVCVWFVLRINTFNMAGDVALCCQGNEKMVGYSPDIRAT